MRHRRLVAKLLVIALISLLTLNWVAAQGNTPEVTPEPAAAQPLVASVVPTTETVATEAVYTVKPGETLFRIALRFHTTVQALATANKIANPALIYAGQQLHIPGAAAPTATPAAPQPTLPPTAT